MKIWLASIGIGAAFWFVALTAILPHEAQAQVSSGKVTTAAPTYVTNTAQPLSLDTSGNLRVTGSFAPPALQNVNITQIAGTAVSNTTPGLLDVNCASGCAGAGNSKAQATTAAPAYVNGTSNDLSMDLAGNLRTLPIGNVAHDGVDAGNPIKTGCFANSSAPTAVGVADRANTWCFLNGQNAVSLVSSATGTAVGVSTPSADNQSATAGLTINAQNLLFTGSNTDRQRVVTNGTDSTGVGIAATGVLAQLDDTSPTTITENQFGNVRLTPNRSLMTAQPVSTVSTTITRPADTNAYAANDALANSTSAPTSGGFTLTNACAVSGGNGTIQSAIITASGSTAYNGEIWLFDQAVTAVNDNAALTITDGEAQTLVGVIPFNTTDINAANSISYVTGLNIGFTCVGSANLRFLVKIMQAVTPASAEVLSVRVQLKQ